MGTRIAITGRQFMDREEAGQNTPLHQLVYTELADDAALFVVQGVESGQRLTLRCTDPGAIAYLRERDHAEFVVSLSQRPALPEPKRVPVPGPGTRTCWLCGGAGQAEGIDSWQECAQCHGDGVIADEPAH